MRGIHRVLGIALLLLLWWFLPDPKGAIPPLGNVLGAGYEAATKQMVLTDVYLSVRRIFAGSVIGILAASILGAACIFPTVRGVISGPLELARPIPPIAWIPLAIVLFGVGEASAIALVSAAVFFPVLLAVILALDGIDQDLVQVARSLGASRAALARCVYFPAMLPIVLTGIRIGVGIGWFSVVAAEMVGSHRGLGYGIQIASLNLEMERFFVYLSLIGICGFAMNLGLLRLSSYLTPWRIMNAD